VQYPSKQSPYLSGQQLNKIEPLQQLNGRSDTFMGPKVHNYVHKKRPLKYTSNHIAPANYY